MEVQQLVFWILSALTLLFAVGVIVSRNPIASILFLILTFFTISGHYVMMNAQFLAIVNIIVYAGAIMVLFLFVVMLMNLNSDTEPQKNLLVQFAGVLSGGILLLVLVATVKSTLSGLETTQVDLKNMSDIGLIKTLGKTLFSEYVFPFEIASILFLSAIVGAVVLSKNDSNLHTTNDVA